MACTTTSACGRLFVGSKLRLARGLYFENNPDFELFPSKVDSETSTSFVFSTRRAAPATKPCGPAMVAASTRFRMDKGAGARPEVQLPLLGKSRRLRPGRCL